MSSSEQLTVAKLLERHGTTYAQQAGITVEDTPSSLYQLLVLATLLSTRISADTGVTTARELFKAGYRTPEKMLAASWQQRVNALGRGGYRRYDFSTSTRLGDGATLIIERYHGDLRQLRHGAQNVRQVTKRLTEFPGIGPTGAAIFLREVQGIWPEYAPFMDAKALQGAKKMGLPEDAAELATLVEPHQLPALTAALVRVALKRSKGNPLE